MTIILLEEILNKPVWAINAKKRMKHLNITQKDIAEHVKVTLGAVGHWFSGRRSPTLYNLDVLASFLKTTSAELLHESKDVNELKGGSKNLKDALVLLCRFSSITTDDSKVFFQVIDNIGVENIIKTVNVLNESEKTNRDPTEVIVDIMDYVQQTG